MKVTMSLPQVEEDEMFEAIADGRCAGTIMSYDEWRIQEGMPEKNTDCQFTFVGRNIKHLSAGFAVMHNHAKCSWLVRDVLDLHLQEMVDEGFMDKIWSSHLQKMHNQTCQKPTTGKPTQMNPENAAGIFILMLITSVFAIMLSSLDLSGCTVGGINQQNMAKQQELADQLIMAEEESGLVAVASEPAARRTDLDGLLDDRSDGLAVCR
jgi:hypothetical protein